MELVWWAAISVSTFLGVILASGSGTGGGALYMPGFLLAFRDAHRAVPLAKVTIFGLSTCSLILNFGKRHPKSNRPLINFEICALIETATLVGAVIGVLLNIILPSVVLLGCLVVVLSITAAQTFKSGFKHLRKEQLEAAQHADLITAGEDSGTSGEAHALHDGHLLRRRSGLTGNQQANGSPADDELPLISHTPPPPPGRAGRGIIGGYFHHQMQNVVQAPADDDEDDFHSSLTITAAAVGDSVVVDNGAGGGGRRKQRTRTESGDYFRRQSLGTDGSSEEFLSARSYARIGKVGTTGTGAAVVDSSQEPVNMNGGKRRGSVELGMRRLPVESALFTVPPNAEALLLTERDGRPHYNSIAFLVLVWSINFTCLTIAGGPGALACGEPWQRAMVSLSLASLVFLDIAYALYIFRVRARRVALGIVERPVEFGGYSWVTPAGLALYPAISFLAGVCAGGLGIGGGLIKGPLLIAIGLEPLSAVTSALYMVLFTSTTTTLSYALNGRLELLPSIWFFFVAATGAVIGIRLITYVAQRFNRPSVISFFLGVIIFVSMCCMIFTVMQDQYGQKGGATTTPLTLDDACRYLQTHGVEAIKKSHELHNKKHIVASS